MASVTAVIDTNNAPLETPFPNRVEDAFTHAPLKDIDDRVIVDETSAFGDVPTADGTTAVEARVVTPTSRTAVVHDKGTMAFDWFEKFHVIPRSVSLGNILSEQNIAFEVYNAYREEAKNWTAFTNNAGTGITLNTPSLPDSVDAQNGIQMTLTVSTSGTAFVNSTLDFTFSPGFIQVPISLQRVVLWSLPPELPYKETLEFLTDIILHKNGTEQRIALRKNPRQFFDWTFLMEDSQERNILDNLLFDFQSRTFGIPQWHEMTCVASDITANDTTITVDSTDYADYRTDELAIIYESQTKFDVLTISSFTASTITFTSGTLNSYTAADNVLVMPLRIAAITRTVQGKRFPSGVLEQKIQFRVKENDANLADTTGWDTFNSKVLVNDCNVVTGGMQENFTQKVRFLDSETGLTFEDSSWDHNKRISVKKFWAQTREEYWKVRKLLHAFRGRQISFYLPTFSTDLELDQDLSSGLNTMLIKHVGYTNFVRERVPRNVIRVIFEDGSTPLIRTINSSVETSATTETLTVDSAWPSNITIAEVKRIEYVELVRANSDRVTIDHRIGRRSTVFEMPVFSLFE